MAYKRYFYRNGKRLGPYYYESFRDENGKVRKRYVGTIDPNIKQEENVSLVKKEEVTNKNFGGDVSGNNNFGILIILIILLILTDALSLFLFFVFRTSL